MTDFRQSNTMELLVPAGGMEQLRAAIRFGADAVYLATEKFGMRARATNFALDDLPAAVALAHSAGVKVYMTCNILMHDAEIAELPAYFRALDEAGVDAAIVCDLGAATLLREVAPRLALHVSTQASVANAAAAHAWYALGARRIVCAREMSVEQIAAMHAQLPEDLELEVFVHGAMCMAVSGRCLISAYLTGRSGNKGHCTQPCRWNYTLEEEKRPGQHFPIEEDENGTYIMNAKDLNMLSHLDDLARAGVASIKIEGRNKKAFYVATVVNAYRAVLDGADPELYQQELESASHRPFSTGFYYGPPEQATDYDGYEQTSLHVADVLGAKEAYLCVSDAAQERNGVWAAQPEDFVEEGYVYALCRNRFAEGDELEVLAPGCAPFSVTVSGLQWFSPEGTPAQTCEVANRATNLYRFSSERAVPEGSYLRMRTFRRSARSGN